MATHSKDAAKKASPAEKDAVIAAVWRGLKAVPLWVWAIAFFTAIGLGLHYRHEIAKTVALLILTAVATGCGFLVVTGVAAIIEWFCGKCFEGVKQIKRGLDWIPGWVYLLLVASVCAADWYGALPFGLRELNSFLNSETPGDVRPKPLEEEGPLLPPPPGMSKPSQTASAQRGHLLESERGCTLAAMLCAPRDYHAVQSILAGSLWDQ